MKFSFAEVDKLKNFTFTFTSNISIYPGKSQNKSYHDKTLFNYLIIPNVTSWNATRWLTRQEDSYIQDLADCTL